MLLPHILATWFGCGLAPKAPGTVGSLGAIVCALPISRRAPWTFGLAALLLFPVSVWSAGRTAVRVGRKDPQIVVIDEVEGQWIALAGATHLNWIALVIGFSAFRLFDIWKPLAHQSAGKAAGRVGNCAG